jgi:photosystem II stability/assembly factor-like uncharacterized protein
MKKKLFYGLIILCGILSLSCNEHLVGIQLQSANLSSWQLLRASPNDGNYYDLFFLDENNGWITGDSGKILYSSNGGADWEKQNSPIHEKIHSIIFLDKNNGWVCGGRYILHTNDGGVNWQVQFQDTDPTQLTNPKVYFQILFVNASLGFAVNNYGELCRTTDAGNKWVVQTKWDYRGAARIFFVNDMVGYVFTIREIYKTKNGGETWDKFEYDTPLCTGIYFTNENIGWSLAFVPTNSVIINSPIYKTTDGGRNWIFVDSLKDSYLNDISFFDNKTGIILGTTKIFMTTDGGNNWEVAADFSQTDVRFVDIAVVDKKNVWVSDYKGVIYKSSD